MWQVALVCLATIQLTQAQVPGHPLQEYVDKPDDAYEFFEIAAHDRGDHVVHVINMTSQRWMTDEFSDRSLWWHYVVMVRPTEIKNVPDQSSILVGIGNMDDPPPDPDSDPFIPLLADLARDTGSVAGMITNIPNQPCTFADDPSQMARTEDAIIAWTWALFMNDTVNRETEPLLYFPMVKGVVRAMDTISAAAKAADPFWDIDKYLITGPSKRGWTTWLTGAVDSRVVALAPMVLSVLNMVPNLHHHYQSLGGWSWAFADYWNEGLTSRLDSEDTAELTLMQDPYEFRDYLDMPKLIIKAGNDEFFMFDDTHFWFDDLPGENHFWILQNAMHIMVGHYQRMAANLGTFFLQVHGGATSPYLTYNIESDPMSARTEFTVSQEPHNMTVWYAYTNNNDKRRDWRWLILGENGTEVQQGVRFYNDVPVEDLGNNSYQVAFDAPPDGWIAFFVTVMFDSPLEGRYIEYSTEPNVVPNTFGYPDCTGVGCKGIIK